MKKINFFLKNNKLSLNHQGANLEKTI